MHLQKGSVHCICNRVSRQSADSGLGVAVGSKESWGVSSGVGLRMVPDVVQLLVWKAGPSVVVAVSILTVVGSGFTNLERQSAAFFFAPEIHSK